MIKCLIIIFTLSANAILSQVSKMLPVKSGDFTPQYTSYPNQVVHVAAFKADISPVSNAQFLDFVRKKPQWMRSKVAPLFAASNYLNNWINDTVYPAPLKNAPVTNVSWFAAKAYCECQGKRLPTTNEWEYMAMASATKVDARKDSSYIAAVLSNYEKRNSYTFPVGKSKANFWGIFNLNELVWEWTQDFSSTMFSDGSSSAQFCGSGTLSANDLADYPSFIRYAFRNGLKANFCIQSLGFRCVK